MTFNQRILMSDAEHYSIDQPINPYYGTDPLDKERAIAEHASIRQALESVGVEVITTASPVDSQDGVYIANWALVRGEVAVIARLPNIRRAEEAFAVAALEKLGKQIVRIPEGLKFSGQGDALPCGRYLFCGQGYRSDAEAQAIAAAATGLECIQLRSVPKLDADGQPVINATSGWADSFYYDIDLALAIIREPSLTAPGLIAYCQEAFDEPSQKILAGLKDFEKILVTEDEATKAFATNLVSTGEAVVMSAHAPLLRGELEARGLRVVCPEVSELSKGGGYIRCTTLSLS
jgi:N-dimethylarginine dimethylaminohydrolase